MTQIHSGSGKTDQHMMPLALRSLLDKKNHPKWILEVDIAKFRSNRSRLPDGTLPPRSDTKKNGLRTVTEVRSNGRNELLETTEGTPQGNRPILR